MGLIERKNELKEELQDQLAVIAERYPVKDLGDVFEATESLYQAYACCALLVDADVTKYQERLLWSAMARRSYLRRCLTENHHNDLHQALSRSDALFCGLAAGDLALVAEIGALSGIEFDARGEYPDDFAYHRLLHALLKDVDAGALATLLAEYEVAMDGIRLRDRLDVCAALVGRDGDHFDIAFESLVEAHGQEMEEERPMNEEKPDFEPKSRLFVEGLALLRLAELRQLPIAIWERPPLIPALAIVAPLATRPQDLFSLI
jgi:hypothetical protein